MGEMIRQMGFNIHPKNAHWLSTFSRRLFSPHYSCLCSQHWFCKFINYYNVLTLCRQKNNLHLHCFKGIPHTFKEITQNNMGIKQNISPSPQHIFQLTAEKTRRECICPSWWWNFWLRSRLLSPAASEGPRLDVSSRHLGTIWSQKTKPKKYIISIVCSLKLIKRIVIIIILGCS